MIRAPSAPVTDKRRDELDRAFGAKHLEGARTPAEITAEVLADHVAPGCAKALGVPLAQIMVNEYSFMQRWEIEAEKKLPRALALTCEEIFRYELDEHPHQIEVAKQLCESGNVPPDLSHLSQL